MLKNNKGITLVALVITIIVLLILAGVSISLVVGDNGVLTQAQGASRKTDVASANSAMELALSSISTEFMGSTWTNNVNAKIYQNVTIEKLKNELKENGFSRVTVKDATITVTRTTSGESPNQTYSYAETMATAPDATTDSANITVSVKTLPEADGATGATTYHAMLITIQEDANAKDTDTSYTYLVRTNSDGTRISAVNVASADSSYGVNEATDPALPTT